MGKQRARHGRRGRGVYTPPATIAAEQTLAYLALAAISSGQPKAPPGSKKGRWGMLIHAQFACPPPTMADGACPRAADSDNIEKLVLDALKGHFYEDDRLVDFNCITRSWNGPANVLTITTFLL